MVKQLVEMEAEFRRLDALASAGALGGAALLPTVASPTVQPIASPLPVAAAPRVEGPQVAPVIDPSGRGAMRAKAEKLVSALGALPELKAMLAVSDPAELQALLLALREAAT